MATHERCRRPERGTLHIVSHEVLRLDCYMDERHLATATRCPICANARHGDLESVLDVPVGGAPAGSPTSPDTARPKTRRSTSTRRRISAVPGALRPGPRCPTLASSNVRRPPAERPVGVVPSIRTIATRAATSAPAQAPRPPRRDVVGAPIASRRPPPLCRRPLDEYVWSMTREVPDRDGRVVIRDVSRGLLRRVHRRRGGGAARVRRPPQIPQGGPHGHRLRGLTLPAWGYGTSRPSDTSTRCFPCSEHVDNFDTDLNPHGSPRTTW